MTTPASAAPIHAYLPDDSQRAHLLGRIDFGAGPTPVLLHAGEVFDLSAYAPTVSGVLEKLAADTQATALDASKSVVSAFPGALSKGSLDALNFQFDATTTPGPRLLPPIDLQCIKGCSLTFAAQILERVLAQVAQAKPEVAAAVRGKLAAQFGDDLVAIQPDSPAAAELKTLLGGMGLWLPYLEAAYGRDVATFTKAPVLAAVGLGQAIGIHPDSRVNNPEPEVVLVIDSRGQVRGAMLGNDVHLRDIDGRCMLLMDKAKDNAASCALGPFIRLFDAHYTLADIRDTELTLDVTGADGYQLHDVGRLQGMSRAPLDLVAQVIGPNHHYPDGLVLFTGACFNPNQDRDVPGQGFTHHTHDRVRIRAPRLGTLENHVLPCAETAPWTQGISALMRNLAARGLL